MVDKSQIGVFTHQLKRTQLFEVLVLFYMSGILSIPKINFSILYILGVKSDSLDKIDRC